MGARPPKWLNRPAVLWAMDEAPGVPWHLVSTLIAYARYADTGGRGSYPLRSTVAAITRKSVSQAGRDAAELQRLGLLLPGDPDLVKHIRADWRPKVYDLATSRGASRAPRQEPNEVHTAHPAESGHEVHTAPERGASRPRTRCIPPPNEVHPAHTE